MLILALIVVLLMTVIVSDVFNVSMVEYETSVNVGKLVRLKYALDAGFEIAKANLLQDSLDTDIDSLSEPWAQPMKEQIGGESAESVKERASEEGVGLIEVNIEIEDEESKWPLPLVVIGNDAQAKRRREYLAAVIDAFREDYGNYDLDQGQAERYADLMASFISRRENDVTGPVPRPNTKSDVHILSVADLTLIKDLDDSIFYDQVDESGTIIPGLLRFLTISSDLQVNVNTAPRAVLKGLFRREDRIRADDIYHHRTAQAEEKAKDDNSIANRLEKGKGKTTQEEEEDREGGAVFTKVDDVQKVEGFTPRVFNEARTMMTVTSKTFSIWITAELGNLSRTRHWIVRRDGSRIVVLLSESIDPDYRPRFRKRTPEEEEESAALKPR
jgi:type II secretory pathway component PulK